MKMDMEVEKDNKIIGLRENRLARVATEQEGKKVQVDLDGRNVTRRRILVDRVDMAHGVNASSEDECIFYHNSTYIHNGASLDAEVVTEDGKTVLKVTPNVGPATNSNQR